MSRWCAAPRRRGDPFRRSLFETRSFIDEWVDEDGCHADIGVWGEAPGKPSSRTVTAQRVQRLRGVDGTSPTVL